MNIKNNPLIKFLINNFIDSSYCIGYRFSNTDFWSEDKSKFRVLKPSIRYWYADPIPFKYKERYYIFMERYDCFNQIGDISVSAVKHNGKLEKPQAVISKKTHLSFPIIIPFKGQYYMLPETSATDSIDIFKMNGTPYRWEHYYSIGLKEKIVDAAWLIDEQGIILLGGIPDSKNPMRIRRQVIRLNHLDDTDRINYEIGYTDEHSSLNGRNGGAFLLRNKSIYRVAQESTDVIYGLALILNKVSDISDNKIEETNIKRKTAKNVKADLNKCLYKKIGIHTYGYCEEGFEVIDISVAKVSLLPLIRKLKINALVIRKK